jgi:transcriptional regulator of arginine metabolism
MPYKPEVTAERHATVHDILSREQVASQDQLRALLRKRGFDVTQSSVSRDLRELGAAKIAGRYVLRADLAGPRVSRDALSEIGPWLSSVACAGAHLLVLHTPPGRASAVALALDDAGWREVIGSVAGDDTVFLATARRADQARVESRLLRLKEQNHGQ